MMHFAVLLLVIGIAGYCAWIWVNELMDAQDSEWEEWW